MSFHQRFNDVPSSLAVRKPRSRWSAYGEPLAFIGIFLAGLALSLLHLFTWLIPHWNNSHDFAERTCIILRAEIIFAPIESENGDSDAPPASAETPPSAPLLLTPQPPEPVREDASRCRVEFLIRYSVDGEEFELRTDGRHPITSERESEFPLQQAEAEALLEQFPVGSEVPCLVAVDDAHLVLLLPENIDWGWYVQGITLAVMAFGAVGFWWSIRHRSISAEQRAVRLRNGMRTIRGEVGEEPFPTIPDSLSLNDSPGTQLAFRLPTDLEPSIRLTALLAVSLLWNAVSWGCLLFALWSINSRTDLVFTILFGFCFCGFGLVLLIWSIQQLLVAFGCGPTLLEISDHPVYPGRRYRLILTQPGVFRVVRLELSLVCEEIARFRQGTDTITNRKEVFRHSLFVREDFETSRDAPLQQELLLRLPYGAMHSMRCESNEIVWKIVLHARLDGWPDLLRECPIVVRPSMLNQRLAEEEES